MTLPSDWIIAVFVFLLGLEFGSFSNVCIYRWPRASSVSRPARSQCPWCGHQIAWQDNIPVMSYLRLGGRCRHCRSPISARYPIVELAVAVLWTSAYFSVRPIGSPADGVRLAGIFAFLFVAVVTTMTDLDWRLIPDEASATLVVAGLLTSVANPHLGTAWPTRLLGSVLGLVVGGGSIWLIGTLGTRVFGRDAMGGGDVKLLAGMGAVLGWDGALFTLFVAAFIGGIGSIFALLAGRLKRQQYIPFGPFLNLAGTVTLFYLCSRGDLLGLLEGITR